jgi:sulfonate transport system ATP-binding protein
VLLVTHDVDEAMLLAHRVLVLTDGITRSTMPAPRSRAGDDHTVLRARLLAELGVDERAPISLSAPATQAPAQPSRQETP